MIKRIILGILLCANIPPTPANARYIVDSVAVEKFEKGDRVLVKFGPREFEATVINPGDGFADFVEVEYESDGEWVTRKYPGNFLVLLEAANDKTESESAFRTWSDSTGKHKIKARLIRNDNGRVEIEKEDGRVVTLQLEQLSETDQQYLADLAKLESSENDPDNPFAGGVQKGSGNRNNRSKAGRPGGLPRVTAPTIDPEFGTNIVDLYVDNWTYRPDSGTSSNKLKSIRYNVVGGDKPFFDKSSGLMISLNKKMAATLISNAFNKAYSTVVIFDLENGKMVNSARISLNDAQIMAVSNDGKQIATVPSQMGGTDANYGMTIWDLSEGQIRPQPGWKTADFHDRGGFKPFAGAFLGKGRLLTVGRNVILWDTESKTDLYTVEGIQDGAIAFSANNRRFAFQRGDSIFLADTATGKCLGVLETSDSSKTSLAFSQSGEFLAVSRWFSNEIRIWDLKNQEIIREMTAKTAAARSLYWVGDEYLLINGTELYDVALRVPVWQYVHGSVGNIVSTNDGRFWLLDKSTLRAVRIPEKNLAKRLSKIDPDSLLVFQPGDEVELEVKLPFPRKEQDEIYEHLAKQLEDNGMTIQSNAELKLVTSVERLKSETDEVTDFHDPFGRRGVESITYSPTKVSVKLMKGDDVIWTRSSTYRPGMYIRLENSESAQQAANRLCQADSSFFLRVKIPKKISQLPGGKPLGRSNLFNF